MKHMKSNLLLALAAFIWGIAFVAQSVSMDHIGPFTFTCIRNLVAALTLYLLLPVLDKITGTTKKPADQKALWIGGIACGCALCVASMFQQVGIMYTTVGKAFLTALYTVIVPILSLFMHKKSNWNVYVAVGISMIGMYFLSVTEDFSIAYGDALVMVCAFMFAIHILVIDHFLFLDGIRMSCIQFLTAGLLCLIPMFVLEHPSMQNIIDAAVPILYSGILSSGAGYTLQSVFAALAGAVILHESLSSRELFGCVLVFGAIILSQIQFKKETK